VLTLQAVHTPLAIMLLTTYKKILRLFLNYEFHAV
jgi:hypothetical protein